MHFASGSLRRRSIFDLFSGSWQITHRFLSIAGLLDRVILLTPKAACESLQALAAAVLVKAWTKRTPDHGRTLQVPTERPQRTSPIGLVLRVHAEISSGCLAVYTSCNNPDDSSREGLRSTDLQRSSMCILFQTSSNFTQPCPAHSCKQHQRSPGKDKIPNLNGLPCGACTPHSHW